MIPVAGQDQPVGEVIHVLGSKSEVNQVRVLQIEGIAEEDLARFQVVADPLLDPLDPLEVLTIERGEELPDPPPASRSLYRPSSGEISSYTPYLPNAPPL